MGKQSAFDMQRFFQALGDNTRLRLLQPKISRHLAYLRRAGMVAARRQGTWMHYRMVLPQHAGAAQILLQTLAWMKEERTMHADRAKLSKACCAPEKYAAWQGAPLPAAVACCEAC